MQPAIGIVLLPRKAQVEAEGLAVAVGIFVGGVISEHRPEEVPLPDGNAAPGNDARGAKMVGLDRVDGVAADHAGRTAQISVIRDHAVVLIEARDRTRTGVAGVNCPERVAGGVVTPRLVYRIAHQLAGTLKGCSAKGNTSALWRPTGQGRSVRSPAGIDRHSDQFFGHLTARLSAESSSSDNIKRSSTLTPLTSVLREG